MKKIISQLFAAVLCLSFASCGGEEDAAAEEISMFYSVKGETTVSSLSAVRLKNGDVKCTIEYTAPEGLSVAAYDLPDGDLFLYIEEDVTTGKTDTLELLIKGENFEKINEITVNFYAQGSGENYIFLRKDLSE